MKSRSHLTLQNEQQIHENYTSEDQQVWQELFDRQMKNIPSLASRHFIKGLEEVGFNRGEIPEFRQVNEILGRRTGWKVVPVEGIVDDRTFFQLMSNRKFPATTWLRSMDELEYLEEPDMFHDVFAHVPLLANPAYASFLERFSQIGLQYDGDEQAIELLSRVYWFTVEFGLIRESGNMRIYGAGILSSSGESVYSVGIDPMHFEYGVEQILNTPFRKDVFQDRYFIIDSFEKLFESVGDIEMHINTMMKKRVIFA